MINRKEIKKLLAKTKLFTRADLMLLQEVNSHQSEKGYALSFKQLSENLGRQVSSVRRSYSRLKSEGYILEAESDFVHFNGTRGTARWINLEVLKTQNDLKEATPKNPDNMNEMEAYRVGHEMSRVRAAKKGRKIGSKYPTLGEIKAMGGYVTEDSISNVQGGLMEFFPQFSSSEAYEIAAYDVWADIPFMNKPDMFRELQFEPLINKVGLQKARDYYDWLREPDPSQSEENQVS